MKRAVVYGQLDYSVLVFIPDPASTDGSGKTGLTAASLTVSYTRVQTDNQVTLADATSALNNLSALTSAHSDWGLLEVSGNLAPGLYRLDIADAVFASGAWSAVVYVMITVSAAAASPMEFVLGTYNPLESVGQTGDAYAALTVAQAEPSQGAPAVNASPLTKLAYLFKSWRNKKTQTATTFSVFNDAGSVVDQKSTASDDGSTTTRGLMVSGP